MTATHHPMHLRCVFKVLHSRYIMIYPIPQSSSLQGMFQCHPPDLPRVLYYLWYDMLFAFGTLTMVTLMVLMRCACRRSGAMMRNGAHGDSIGDRSGKHGQKLTGTARFWGSWGSVTTDTKIGRRIFLAHLRQAFEHKQVVWVMNHCCKNRMSE